MVMGKLARLLDHIQNGTLLDRMIWKWREQVRKRRIAWWESQREKREYYYAKVDRGVRMRLHLDNKLAELIYCDSFEHMELEFLRTFLRAGDIFVDVGANIGLFSLTAAFCFKDAGKVFAFEPAGQTFKRLKDNVTLNSHSNVHCFQLALSDETGEFPLFTSEDGYDAWNSFAPPIAGKSFSREFIQCDTWNHFARRYNLIGKVTMMKIDVEGLETRVLAGGLETLSRDDAPILQVEFTDEAARSAGSSCIELYHAIEDLGNHLYTYDLKTRELVPDPVGENYPYVNLIATKATWEVSDRLRKPSIWRLFK